jgi:hypothetical protein
VKNKLENEEDENAPKEFKDSPFAKWFIEFDE